MTVSDYFSTKFGWPLIEKMTEPKVLFKAIRGLSLPSELQGTEKTEKEIADLADGYRDMLSNMEARPFVPCSS